MAERGEPAGIEREPAAPSVPLTPEASIMTTTCAVAAAIAAFRARAPEAHDQAAALLYAAQLLLPDLERGRRIDSARLRSAMDQAFGGSDSQGVWDWKNAYDACEAAAVLFVRKFGCAMTARAGSCDALLPMLAKVAGLLPTHTRRSEESETFQQFSTPLVLGLAVGTAAAVSPTDHVLEPSAGTGLLAIFAELAGVSLMLNELAENRAGLLSHLFPGVGVTRFDAARVDDHLGSGIVPSVVLMNPPFSALANVDRRRLDAAFRHVSSALARLAEGGRLVAITGASCAPDHPAWREDFVRLQEHGTVVFSAAIDGSVYAQHGTTIDTRLTVIDKRAAPDATIFPASPGTAPDAVTLLRWVMELVPAKLPLGNQATKATALVPVRGSPRRKQLRNPWVSSKPSSSSPAIDGEIIELTYETVDWKPAEAGRLSEVLYEDYALQSIRIPDAQAHPTRLVQCREAVERRDRLIEHLASLDPVPGALDRIVQHFGSEQVAEVTGRSRRIIAKVDGAGDRRLAVESRAGSANLAETQAFQDDEKRILVFSDAGGTGRSYHADLGARNRRLRVHYLLEAGWKADTAIQGLGRTNRTNQAQPPLFRPIATDVKAENGSCPPSPGVSTASVPSPRASGRREGRVCSGQRTIWRASMRGRRFGSSTPCSTQARSRAARSSASLTRRASR